MDDWDFEELDDASIWFFGSCHRKRIARWRCGASEAEKRFLSADGDPVGNKGLAVRDEAVDASVVATHEIDQEPRAIATYPAGELITGLSYLVQQFQPLDVVQE
jgi:hypothetical protein